MRNGNGLMNLIWFVVLCVVAWLLWTSGFLKKGYDWVVQLIDKGKSNLDSQPEPAPEPAPAPDQLNLATNPEIDAQLKLINIDETSTGATPGFIALIDLLNTPELMYVMGWSGPVFASQIDKYKRGTATDADIESIKYNSLVQSRLNQMFGISKTNAYSATKIYQFWQVMPRTDSQGTITTNKRVELLRQEWLNNPAKYQGSL